jgi:hypothetical protein
MSNLNREPSIDASYQVLVQLAKRFQRRRFFRNQPIRNKNCCWLPCLLTDLLLPLICKPSLVYYCKDYLHMPNGNIFPTNYLQMLKNLDEMSKFYRGSSIDASHQVSVHLGYKLFGNMKYLTKSLNHHYEVHNIVIGPPI